MTRFEKWSVLSASVLTGITGLGYLWVKYAMESTDPWSVINHPLQPWLLKSHILISPLLIFAVGSISIRHVWRHFRSGGRRGRRSGLSTAISIAPMVVTGYLIQSVTNEPALRAIVILHIASSIIFLIGLAIHSVVLAQAAIPAVARHFPGSMRRSPVRARSLTQSREPGGKVISG